MLLHLLHTFLSFLWFQSRFADALLRELAGITIPPERIYGLGTGLVLLFDIFIQIQVQWCIILIFHFVNTFVSQTILYFLSSPKVEVLKKLQNMPEHQGLALQLRLLCIQK